MPGWNRSSLPMAEVKALPTVPATVRKWSAIQSGEVILEAMKAAMRLPATVRKWSAIQLPALCFRRVSSMNLRRVCWRVTSNSWEPLVAKGSSAVERTSFGQSMTSGITRIRDWVVDEVSNSVVFLWKLLWPVALVVIGAMAFHLPYLMHFHRAGMGIGTLWKYRQTTNLDGFLTMFGFFMFIFITQFVRWWWDVQKSAGCSGLKSMCILLSLIVLLTGIWAGFLHFPEKSADFSVLMISLFLMILILWIMLRGYPTNTETFPLLLALTAVGITAGCEVFFIRDFYQGGDMRRFNTIFKFYLQAWFMFSVASAYLIARRTRIRAQSPNLRKNQVLFRRLASWSWTLVFLFLLGGSLIFTVWGVHARHFHDEYRRVKLPLTLDGWAYMKNGLPKGSRERVQGNQLASAEHQGYSGHSGSQWSRLPVSVWRYFGEYRTPNRSGLVESCRAKGIPG